MPTTERRYDLDWLRIGATLLLFPYHVAKTFDVTPMYHVKNAVLVPQLDYFTAFIHQWHMPLFFALAGWSAYGSLARRGTREFLRERVQRVLVPFLAGTLLLCPLVKYVELSGGLSITASGAASLAAPFHESFLQFLPTFYTRIDRFTWSHLWFLLYLLAFTLVLLPVLAPATARSTRADARTATPGATTAGRLYLPLVPLILIQTTLRFRWPGVQNLYDDWANVTYYGLFFFLGFVLAWRPEWELVIAREWRRAGAIGLLAVVAMLLGWVVRGGVHWPVEPTWHGVATALPMQVSSGVAGYCLVIAILGGARTHLGSATLNDAPRVRALRQYLAEAALPIYVLHQLAIVALAYYIVRLDVGIPIKLVLLLGTSVVATFVVYHYGVRRFPLARACLGMKATAARRPIWRATPVIRSA